MNDQVLPVVNAYLYPGGEPPNAPHNNLDERIQNINILDRHPERGLIRAVVPEMEIWRRLDRPDRPRAPNVLDGVGDGIHNIIFERAHLAPSLVIIRERPEEPPLWRHIERLLPMIAIISSTVFRRVMTFFSIDIHDTFFLGLSYNANFMIFQCILAFTSYWLKGMWGS
ncbi:uncharacterized protein LOC115626510 [Scaptodrosophila lebanonensis]|uniref:Uncharacterized protein LOC115626510 n=1 Tax=Drosophila lebanonensis TaxID=7225 RepID=A0A6J2TRM4_DROLE|nr:uncharacterized protein LOC115626510 [Scaptodrosophila lebanonensis]